MLRKSLLASAVCGVVTLSGCGSSGSSDGTSPPPASNTTLSGTIAAGAPLKGFLAIKDANSDVVTTDIDANGNYSVDLRSKTPPFVLFASGVAGGKAYTIASAATADDLNGTVNVTPLTDVVIGNVGGKDGQEFFNTPDYTRITATALNGAKSNLKTRLQPVLDAAGVAADFDLVKTGFSADHTGIDGVLDVLDVVVDPNTETATITYAPDPTVTIIDDLTIETDITPITTPANVSGDISATQAISQMIAAFNAEFSAGIPSATALDPYFDVAFMYDGINKTMGMGFFTSTNPVDVQDATQFRSSTEGFSIAALDSVNQTATISFGTGEQMNLANTGNGWVFTGNGYTWASSTETETHWSQTNTTIRTELNFSINDNLGTLQAGDYFIIQGPGLPTAGVVMVQHDFNDFANAQGTGFLIYGYTVNDAITATISDGANYTLTRYRDLNGDTNVYATSPTPVTVADATTLSGTLDDTVVDTQMRTLIKRPLLSTETTQFASISAPTAGDLANFSSGNLPVSWTLPAGSRTTSVTFDRFLADGSYERAAENNVTDSTSTTTLTVPAPGTTVTSQSVIVFTNDVFDRTAATTVDVTPGSTTPTTPPAATVSPVGSWDINALGFDSHILTFFPNGYYFQWCNILSGCASDSYEIGTYSGTNSSITVTSHIVNGLGGLDPVGSTFAVAVTGTEPNTGADTIVIANSVPFTRVSDVNNSIVGAWLMNDPQTGNPTSFNPAVSEILVFYADGTYFQWTNPSSAPPSCNGTVTAYAEIGTYSYDAAAGQLTILSHIQNGVGGFDDPANSCLPPAAPINTTIATDTMSFTDFGISFSRVQ